MPGIESPCDDVNKAIFRDQLHLDPGVAKAGNVGRTGSITNGTATRGTDSRNLPTGSPGSAETSVSVAAACASAGAAPSTKRRPASVRDTLRVVRRPAQREAAPPAGGRIGSRPNATLRVRLGSP